MTQQRRAMAPKRRLGGAPQAKSSPVKHLPLPVKLFLCALIVPWMVPFGPLAITVYRLVLLVMFVPCVWWWVSGKAGRIRVADLALLTYCIWCALSLFVVHGLNAGIEAGGLQAIEAFGPYVLARCFIRDADGFKQMGRWLFGLVLVLLPFALFETLTMRNIMLELFATVLPSYPDSGDDIRSGLTRAQTVFEHPILFGVFVGGALALSHLVLGFGKSGPARWWRSLLVFFTACLSLSSGPIATIVLQSGLMAWDKVLKKFSLRWQVLWALAIASYFLIDLASNQTPMQFYISHFTFDQQTGWVRIAIWDFGSASVMNHPLFGVGFGDWDHPRWMTSSIDMFWLLNGVRYGLPAAVLIQLAFFAAVLGVGLRPQTEAMLLDYRTAYLIVMASFYIVGWTVHFWGAPYVLFLFLLGSGVWMLDIPPATDLHESRRSKDQVHAI